MDRYNRRYNNLTPKDIPFREVSFLGCNGNIEKMLNEYGWTCSFVHQIAVKPNERNRYQLRANNGSGMLIIVDNPNGELAEGRVVYESNKKFRTQKEHIYTHTEEGVLRGLIEHREQVIRELLIKYPMPLDISECEVFDFLQHLKLGKPVNEVAIQQAGRRARRARAVA